MNLRRAQTRKTRQRGAVLVELGMLLPVFTVLLVAVFDAGRAYYYSLEVSNAARAGAQYGYQSGGTMMDTTGIQNAAMKDGADIGTISGGSCSGSACWNSGYPQSRWGCMCSDGTGMSLHCASPPTCSTNSRQVNYVDVLTRATYTTLLPWPGTDTTASFTLKGETLLWAGE